MPAKDSTHKKSLMSRIFSADTAIFCVGVACVIYGVANGIRVMQIFFGICIIGGSIALHYVRKTDWDAHWGELDRVRKAHEQRMIDEKEKKN